MIKEVSVSNNFEYRELGQGTLSNSKHLYWNACIRWCIVPVLYSIVMAVAQLPTSCITGAVGKLRVLRAGYSLLTA